MELFFCSLLFCYYVFKVCRPSKLNSILIDENEKNIYVIYIVWKPSLIFERPTFREKRRKKHVGHRQFNKMMSVCFFQKLAAP